MDALALFLQDGAWHMRDGWGWWMIFGWLWMLAFWGLVIWGIMYVVRRIGEKERSRDQPPSSLDILEERYARGELTDEEFENRRGRILGGRQQ